ncbi:flagellar protein FlaI [Halobiforma haloterrestris]|uniref:Flagellar protein FlaI n=1 Tax=Natronobacterium haloterrestre TaxID=148448 RepID=A0A1I1GGZ7_NATHA|nr:ATPase, T2SS/T4P/T4SS family [Halobiforma haloterrestris]SFC10715.1 flagellar protein FlaI [Halobiforma haloterrestris]
MAIDEADRSDAGDFSEGEASDAVSEAERTPEGGESEPSARVGEYTWADFMDEYGYGDEVSSLYPDDPDPGREGGDQLGLETDEEIEPSPPSGDDWDAVEFDPEAYLGYHPDDLVDRVLPIAGDNHDLLETEFLEYVDPETTPVVKDVWTWEHYKWVYYYDENGDRPRDSDGEVVPHDKEEALGFDPDTLEERLSIGEDIAMELDDVVDERTVNVQDDIDEDEFFSTAAGNTTLSNRYDLEKAVPMEKKKHFREVERYWVNKPYAYVVIFHSEKENEKKYYVIEPYLNEIEEELQEFLSGKLRTAIKYSDDGVKEKADEDGRRTVIEDETRRLLQRYDLFEETSGSTDAGIIETVKRLLNDDEDEDDEDDGPAELEGISVRPEPAILADDPDTLTEYQVEKLLYLLKRNFIGYERIDGIKHDINVEDISCDGYNSPVFVYHSEYEQIISNIYHGEDELDDFVVKLAQRSGKGISKRLPQVDATLPDGSRAQLTLGQEVSDHGTNYTIRQFKDVPFTPIDLINWNTFSLDEMAFLWLCIENHKSLIFAGGTASGKTTSLNAVSLFIPSNAKIVSIEDTREVELPQRNWIASVTRPSFADDEQGDVDEFDLLEAALRQRPDYIVMGEIRGEEGRTLFQVMSTGHTTYTTFHADSVDEVLKRFTTDPINVSKTMFTALDLVSIQTQTRVQGRKVRRNKSLTEINHYEAENDEINVQDVYQWQAETDEFLKMGDSNTLEEIQFDRGWSTEKLEEELFKREVILAYLIKNELNTYAEVAATVQAFINDPDTILTLIANGQLEESLEDLREMESVLIDVDQEKEELVPRPEATTETYNTSMDILERAEESLFEEYRGRVPSGLASALSDVDDADTIEVEGETETETGTEADADAGPFEPEDLDDALETDAWNPEDGSTAFGAGGGDESPAWLSEDNGFEVGGDGSDGGVTADAGTASGSADDAGAGGIGGAEADATGAFDAEVEAETEAETQLDVADESGSETGAVVGVETAGGGTETDEETGPFESSAGSTGSTLSGPATGIEAGDDSSSADDSTVFPSDDPEESDFGGLFDDMGETLDELETAETAETAETDGSDHDDGGSGETGDPPVFSVSEGDFESIFDPDSDDGTSTDFTDELENDRAEQAPSGSESVRGFDTGTDTDTDADRDSSTGSGSDDESTGRSTTDREPPTIEIDEDATESTESGGTDESDDSDDSSEYGREPPTIEIDEEEAEDNDGPDERAGDDGSAPGEPDDERNRSRPDHDSDGNGDEDEDEDEDEDVDVVAAGPVDETADTDSSASDTDTGTDTDSGDETETEIDDDNDSIFGSDDTFGGQRDPVFDDAADSAGSDGDDESLFDDPSEAGEESIFHGSGDSTDDGERNPDEDDA